MAFRPQYQVEAVVFATGPALPLGSIGQGIERKLRREAVERVRGNHHSRGGLVKHGKVCRL